MTQQSTDIAPTHAPAPTRDETPAAAAGQPAGEAAGAPVPVQPDAGPGETVDDSPAAHTQPQGQPTTGSAQMVPVTESIRYRRRAQQAERRVTDLEQKLGEQDRAATSLRNELAAAQRRNELTRLLAGRNVIDLDAALLLAEQRMAASAAGNGEPGQGDEGAVSPQDVIEQLLKDKPYLVTAGAANGRGGPGQAGASIGSPLMGRRVHPGEPGSPQSAGGEMLRSAARRAAGTGRGPEMEHYLRLRRRGKS
jgi:hypothetical protein